LTCAGILKDKHRKTTQKTRIIVDSKHVLRLDNEQTDAFEQTDLILEQIENQHHKKPIDVLIFEDYNKGLLTTKTIKACIDFCRENNIKTIVDPKKDNFFAYQHVDIFKPNYKELCEGLGEAEKEPFDLEHTKAMCSTLREKLKAKAIFLTLSEHGVLILTKDAFWHIPAFDRTIIDVSGAGDTVVSVASTALSTELNYKDLAFISNLAGGLVCEQVGVVPIDQNRLENEIRAQHNQQK
ncbi:MAG: bifunctional heptose 7-phosphate kinase/heptose 1-phosphate adenyltransferase, partial [Flavobacteriales bacterium]